MKQKTKKANIASIINEQHVQKFKVKENNLSKTSIYEVIRITDSKTLFLDEHINRLHKSAKIIGINIWLSDEEIENRIFLLITKNKKQCGNIKLIFTSEIENHQQEENFSAYFIEHKYPTDKQYNEGVETAFLSAERQTPNAKVLNTKIRNLANNLIDEKKIYEAILLNNEGFITEGSRSNLFFIKENEVFTSPIEKVLPGISRQKVIEICLENNIILNEKAVSKADLENYNSAFITGTSPHILPIKSIDKLKFDVKNTILRKLMQLFLAKINQSTT